MLFRGMSSRGITSEHLHVEWITLGPINLLCVAINTRHLTVLGCPADWAVLGSNCYKAFDSKGNWQDAENHCQGQGGHLASIHSKEENDFVAGLAKPSDEEPWLGGTNEKSQGSWVWSDGSPFSYTAWGPGQPDNAGGREHCLETNWWGAGQWNTFDCSSTVSSTHHAQKFICKIAAGK